jgi:hypothetical protein
LVVAWWRSRTYAKYLYVGNVSYVGLILHNACVCSYWKFFCKSMGGATSVDEAQRQPNASFGFLV